MFLNHITKRSWRSDRSRTKRPKAVSTSGAGNHGGVPRRQNGREGLEEVLSESRGSEPTLRQIVDKTQRLHGAICQMVPKNSLTGDGIYRKTSGRSMFSLWPSAMLGMRPSRRKIKAGSSPRS